MKYNYYENVKDDVLYYINENYTKEEIEEGIEYDELYDVLFNEDSVTGNASGSYTFSTYQAEEYITHNLDILKDALECFCCEDVNILEKGAEWCDVTIRCYLLPDALAEVLEELNNAN